jgi:hypothetical protein
MPRIFGKDESDEPAGTGSEGMSEEELEGDQAPDPEGGVDSPPFGEPEAGFRVPEPEAGEDEPDPQAGVESPRGM